MKVFHRPSWPLWCGAGAAAFAAEGVVVAGEMLLAPTNSVERLALMALTTLVMMMGASVWCRRLWIITQRRRRQMHARRRSRASTSVSYESVVRTPLFTCIERVVMQKRARFADKALRIDLVTDATARHAFGRCNAGVFERALSNVIDSACDASPEDGVVRVTLDRHEARWLVSVRDEGDGVNPDALHALTHTVPNAAHEDEDDAPMLVSAINACKAWGGSYAISSRPGKGTEIFFTLLAD